MSRKNTSETWKPEEEKYLYKLQVIQNLTLTVRLSLNVPYYVSNKLIHKEANMPKLHDFINKLQENLIRKLTEHETQQFKI